GSIACDGGSRGLPRLRGSLKQKGRTCGPFTKPEIRSLARQQTLALQTLALQLAIAADRLSALTGTFFGRFPVVASELHLAEDAFPLHLLFQRFERLIDIVVANDDLQ